MASSGLKGVDLKRTMVTMRAVFQSLFKKTLKSVDSLQIKNHIHQRERNFSFNNSVTNRQALPEGVNMIQGESVSAVRKGNKIIIAGRNLTEPSYDLPTISSRVAGKKYTYFYASGMYGDGTFRNSVRLKASVDLGFSRTEI